MKEIFLITLVARPSEGTEASREFGGAYVNAWIDAALEDEAIGRARHAVRKDGWIVESVDAVVVVQRSDYEDSDPSRKYFEQALIAPAVLVFHTWPVEEHEDER